MKGLAEWLPSKHEALSSNPSAAQKKQQKISCLAPVILATKEAEIRRIEVRSQAKKGWWSSSRCRP
jgi:hypothetical protein